LCNFNRVILHPFQNFSLSSSKIHHLKKSSALLLSILVQNLGAVAPTVPEIFKKNQIFPQTLTINYLTNFCLSTYSFWKISGIRILLGTEVGLSPGNIVLDGDPASPSERGTADPDFSVCLLWPNGRPSQQLVSSCCRAHDGM